MFSAFRRMDGILVALLLVSLTLNVVLVVQFVRLERSLVPPARSERKIASGKTVPNLTLERADGTRTSLFNRSDSRPTVLYVLSSTCMWCKRNVDAVRLLQSRASTSYRFVGVIIGDPKALGPNDNPGFEVFGVPKDQFLNLDAYGVTGTPSTIVLSPNGQILNGWAGAYSGKTVEQLSQFFGFRMTGI